jgi:hypothetical protein
MTTIEVGQTWYRSAHDPTNGKRSLRLGDPVIVVRCPPRCKWVAYQKQNGVVVDGFHPDVFREYFMEKNTNKEMETTT